MIFQFSLEFLIFSERFLEKTTNTMRNGAARVYRKATKMIGVISTYTILANIKDDDHIRVVATMANHARWVFFILVFLVSLLD